MANIFDITKCPVAALPRIPTTGIILDCSVPPMGIPDLAPYCSCPDFSVPAPLSPPAIPCVVTPRGGGGTGGTGGDPPPGECFIPSAKVLMADGVLKEIKDVVVGDKVQGISGVNTVTALPRFKLGQNKLHGFNGRKPFMTSMHPIKTKKGWANFDPKLFREHWPEDYAQVASENESGDILRLQVGDLVAFWKDKICYEVLDDYVEEENDPAFDVYNLTLDNDRTFIVNGLIAHNAKSPPPCIPPSTGSEKDCCWFMWCPCNVTSDSFYGSGPGQAGNHSPLNNPTYQPWPQPYLMNPDICPQLGEDETVQYQDGKAGGKLSVKVKGDARAPGSWVRITGAGSAENCKISKVPGIHGRYWGDVAIVCFCHVTAGSNISIHTSGASATSINNLATMSTAWEDISVLDFLPLMSTQPDPCISVMSVGQGARSGTPFGSTYPAEMHAAIFGSNKWDNPVIQQTLISQETALTDAWDIDKPQILFDADNKISVPGQYVPQDDSLRFPPVPRDSITGVWRIFNVMHKGTKNNSGASVIPRAQPFEVINVELDYALYGGSASSCSQILGLLIKQDEKYFGLKLAPVNTNTWTKYSGKGLTEESFKEFTAPLPAINAPLFAAEAAQPYFHGDAGAICLGLYVATNSEIGKPAPNVGVCIKNVKISVGL